MGWLAAIVASAALASALALSRVREASSRTGLAAEPGTRAQNSSAELANLKQAIAQLERKSATLESKSSALEHQSAALEANVANRRAEQDTMQPPDPPSVIESHRAELQELDVVLATAPADPRDARAAADTFQAELSTATSGQARIMDVECAAALCKAVIEEDTNVHPEMDISVLVDSTPFLKQEAMFDYQREGTRKRTIIYAARHGQSLAAARGVVLPSNAPKP